MRKVFVCSLCHNGILGGSLYLNNQAVTYVCKKLTVDKKYKKIVLPLNEIKEVSWAWIIFPIATFSMSNGEKFKILIFNKWRFEKCFQEFTKEGIYENN